MSDKTICPDTGAEACPICGETIHYDTDPITAE